jgi:hypothetical protein
MACCRRLDRRGQRVHSECDSTEARQSECSDRSGEGRTGRRCWSIGRPDGCRHRPGCRKCCGKNCGNGYFRRYFRRHQQRHRKCGGGSRSLGRCRNCRCCRGSCCGRRCRGIQVSVWRFDSSTFRSQCGSGSRIYHSCGSWNKTSYRGRSWCRSWPGNCDNHEGHCRCRSGSV